MNDILTKFPELIKALLEKASKSYDLSPDRKLAKDKLISQLQKVMDEISKLQRGQPSNITEEQIKKLMEMPRMLPSSMQWKIKPRKKSGGDTQG